jgi:hypothetical protein
MVALKPKNEVRKILQLFAHLLVFGKIKKYRKYRLDVESHCWLNIEHLSNHRAIS